MVEARPKAGLDIIVSILLSRHTKNLSIFFCGNWQKEVRKSDVTDNIFKVPCMFCEKNAGKMNAKGVELFRDGSVHEFHRLIALITYSNK